MKFVLQVAAGVVLAFGVFAENVHADVICVVKGGALKVYTKRRCPAKTKPFPMQAGGKGDPGPEGAQGAQGLQGDKGEAGPIGLQGEKGDTGPVGPEGPKGDKGDDGAAGAQGPKGDKGDDGAAGAQGPKGDKGDAGAAGAQGPKGDKGDDGAAGPQGLKGDKGDAGAAGAQGPKGDKGDAGAAGPQGPQGEKGVRGDAVSFTNDILMTCKQFSFRSNLKSATSTTDKFGRTARKVTARCGSNQWMAGHSEVLQSATPDSQVVATLVTRDIVASPITNTNDSATGVDGSAAVPSGVIVEFFDSLATNLLTTRLVCCTLDANSPEGKPTIE